MSDSPLHKLFSLRVEDLLATMKLQPPVFLPSDLDVLHSFSILIEKHIQSAPVRDVKTGHFLGFLDMRDLVSAVVLGIQGYEDAQEMQQLHQLEKVHESNSGTTKVSNERRRSSIKEHFAPNRRRSLDKLDNLSPPGDTTFIDHFLKDKRPEVLKKLYDDPAVNVSTSYLCKRHRFVPVFVEDTLIKVVSLLAQKEIHRVPVMSKEGELVAIISQSAIIQYLEKHKTAIPEVLSAKLADIKLGSRTVLSVNGNDSALSAFQKIHHHGLSGLAIVDDEGVLVGNTSASDLRLYVSKPSYGLLKMPVMRLLSVIRQQDVQDRVPVVVVSEDSDLAKVLGKLAATKMHRVFVVDRDHKPVAVISLTDILHYLLSI